MELKELLRHFNNGDTIGEDWAVIEQMRFYSRQARKITLEINSNYHEPDELAELFSELIGEPVGENFGLFPPFYTDFGKNIHIGNQVFINADCKFQDDPEKRQQLHPAPIHIGKRVWVGANATILPGVTIGDNSVVAAGAVVTKDVPADTVVGGVPARVISNSVNT